MRGLSTAFPIMRPGLSRSYGGRRHEAGHKASDGSSPTAVPPPPVREGKIPLRSGDLSLPCHRPHEADELASDRGADDRRLLSASAERAVASGKPALCLPCDLSHSRRRSLQPVELRFADPRWVSIGPSALDQHVAHSPVSGLGNAAAPDRVAGRTFAGYEAEIAHELTWVVKPTHVADLGGERHGYDEVDTAQGLERS